MWPCIKETGACDTLMVFFIGASSPDKIKLKSTFELQQILNDQKHEFTKRGLSVIPAFNELLKDLNRILRFGFHRKKEKFTIWNVANNNLMSEHPSDIMRLASPYN